MKYCPVCENLLFPKNDYVYCRVCKNDYVFEEDEDGTFQAHLLTPEA